MVELDLDRRRSESQLADLIEVRDLSIEFDNRGIDGARARPGLVPHPRRARLSRWSANRAPASRSPRRRSWGSCPRPRASRAGEILFAAPGVAEAADRHHEARPRRPEDPQDPRPPHLDDLPGADGFAVAAAHDRRPGERSALPASPDRASRRACSEPRRCCASWASPIRRARCATIRSSFPAGCASAR